jgi:hypothetical protein
LRRANPKRTVLLVGVGVLVILLSAVALVLAFSTQDIDYAEKCSGGKCWGYELSRHRITGKVSLRFWGTWGLKIVYDLPPGEVELASNDRWLAADRAILVNLRLTPAGGLPADAPQIHILYDFQRGTLALQSRLPLWRSSDYRSGRPDRNWLTEEQFRSMVDAIEQ